MIHRFVDVLTGIADEQETAVMVRGRFVKAVGLPFVDGLIGRLADCWQVFTGRAHVFEWPEAGDFEDATAGNSHRQCVCVMVRAKQMGYISAAQMHFLSEISGAIFARPGYTMPPSINPRMVQL